MKITKRHLLFGTALALAGMAITHPSDRPFAQESQMTFAIPAIPPVFVGVQALVAEKQGIFEDYGVSVDVKNFPTGAEGARAAISGAIDASLSPTPLVINQVTNADADVIAIYGTERPAYYLAATDPDASCETIVGQPVGVDTPGGALSIALKIMLASCGVDIGQVQQVGLSANVPTTMIAGQIDYAVLHLDGVMAVETQTGKTVNRLIDYRKANPVYHNMMLIARKDKISANRDDYVNIVAGLITAERFMRDPANRDAVAKIATVTGRSEAVAALALERYIEMEFWPHDSCGLGQENIEAVAKAQVEAGNIRPGKTPAPYERLVDISIREDALALVKERS